LDVNLTIAKIKFKNYLRNQQELLSLLGRVLLGLEFLARNDAKKLKLYDFYLRFNPRASNTPAVLKKAVAVSKRRWNTPGAPAENTQKMIRSILLKKYVSEKEKGFLLTSFEPELTKLANNPHLAELEKQYEIAFVPTWQPFFSVQFYHFLSKIKQPFWMMPSSTRDADLCPSVTPLCMPLPFQASSWIDGPTFTDATGKKDVDLIMLANFGEYKRHWLLFEALQDIPRNVKVVVAGLGIGARTKEALMAEAALFGVADRFELIENPQKTQKIGDLLARAKLFCALSAKEGSYIGVAEALFAGTPVGIYDNAIVGSKDYLNSTNSVMFNTHEKLSTQLVRFLESPWKLSSPADIQKWARDTISARVHSAKLNSIVKAANLSKGNNWTQDLSPFYCKHFDFIYYENPVDSAEYKRLTDQFGLEMAMPWLR
jgi:glycosyltransferase involved in cell wall biosynthesis